MSKDFKDLINTVEKETKTHAELEATINSLNKEINRLKAIISEQKVLIDDQSDSPTLNTLPDEVDILKDLINSQRQELINKDESNEKLHDQIDALTIKLEKSKDGTFIEQDNEDLIAAQELVLAFTEENDELKNRVEELENQINSISPETSEIEVINQELLEENEEMVNIKRLNFQLMEENGLLRVEVESLKVKLQEKIEEMRSEELQLAYQKIEALTLELDDYEAQMRYLQKKLEEEVVTPLSLSYTTDEFNNLKEELSRYQDENQRLNDLLLEVDQNNSNQLSETEYQSVAFNFPKEFQISLFKRMYNLLGNVDKKAIIDILIKDLSHRNNDIKRAVLKILCEMRDEKVYDAFLGLLHDEDWVIRYKVIKALTNFGFDDEVFKDSLKKLTKDIDIDVRELAMKVLEDIS
ncbi:MAG: HEAT repeat domain-containing protein [Promethearchaeota archaeon]|jgi:chromosome segregation ATPase